MPSDVALSRGIRTNLLSLQEHSANLEISQQRLATGKRVNSALDNPLNYFQADNLRHRGNQLSNLLDQMSLAIKTLELTGKAIERIQNLAESAVGIIKAAASNTDNAARNQARASFQELKVQINNLAQDANFSGKNMLNGGDPAAAYNSVFDLRVTLNEDADHQSRHSGESICARPASARPAPRSMPARDSSRFPAATWRRQAAASPTAPS